MGDTGYGADPYSPSIKLPRIDENADIIRYSSGEEGEDFIVIKQVQSNKYGKFRHILRIENDCAYILYASPFVKELFSEGEQDINTPSPKTSKPLLPTISFTECWVLNQDGDGLCLGDTRSNDVLFAKDICWLTVRFRYKCPSDYKEVIHFDVKLIDPDECIVPIDGEGRKKGYSTTIALETIPRGGILNVSIGNDEPGFFKKGKYVLSVWYNDTLYTSTSIDLQ
jgi:hypothetical protein